METKETRRPPIPMELKREVLLEAGHRCAIPTCRQTPVEVAHIIPWKEGKEHTFDNLIALCPTCHTRYDKGEIDRKSMQQYKANLSVLNGRYSDLEKRVLMHFAERPTESQIRLPGELEILLMFLLRDGFLIDKGTVHPVLWAGSVPSKIYELTNKGREFIMKWLSAEELD